MQLPVFRSLPILSLSLCMLLTIGCGIDTSSIPQASSATNLSGKLFGGESPITGATVRLYATAPNGVAQAGGFYAGTATLLGTTTSLANGTFLFSGVTSCSAPDQLYLTASGGNSGANATNANILELVAIGPCSLLSPSLFINVNEVTTVAAAYALQGFISITGDTVNITSSATNYAGVFDSGSGTYSGTPASASGLVHAFQNANILASFATVTARSAAPDNAASTVPASLLNTLGNVLQSCVNSTGGVATDTSTACGKLFSYTMAGSTAPTTTLQAAINMARFPKQNVASIFALSTPVAAFAPSLSGAPSDWTIGVAYSAVTPAGVAYPYHITSDANDNIYVTNTIPTYTAPTSACLEGWSSRGVLLSGNNGWACSTKYLVPRQVAADANGNVWIANNGTVAAATAAIEQISVPTGVLANTYLTAGPGYGVAVDKSSNVWYLDSTSTAAALFELTYTAGSPATYVPASFTTAPTTSFGSFGIAIDATQNIWIGANNNGSAAVFASPYSGTVATATSAATGGYGISIDASGRGWVPNSTSNSFSDFTFSAGALAFTATSAAGAAASPRYGEVDGAGTLWSPSYTGTGAPGLTAYLTGAGAYVAGESAPYKGCLPAGGTATACGSGSAALFAQPRSLTIDSTGSIWVSNGTGQDVIQVIGAAAPTWPLLATGKPGVMP